MLYKRKQAWNFLRLLGGFAFNAAFYKSAYAVFQKVLRAFKFKADSNEKAEKGGHYSAFIASGEVGHVGGEQLVRETLKNINEMFAE